MRSISKLGLELIAKFEQFKPKAYFATNHERDNEMYTIGYGHLIKDSEEDLIDVEMTKEEALKLLKEDVKLFETGVAKLMKGAEEHLSQSQYDACISLAFNIGLGNFTKSDVLRKILAGNRRDAGKSFKSWTLQAGTRLKGLVRRRAVEKILYETGKDKYAEVFSEKINPFEELGL
jgi:lysozyme